MPGTVEETFEQYKARRNAEMSGKAQPEPEAPEQPKAEEVPKPEAEPVEESENAAAETESPAEGASAAPEKPGSPSRRDRSAEARIRELNAKYKAAADEAAEMRRKLEEYSRQPQPQAPVQKPVQSAKVDEGEPQLEDFDTISEYSKAMVRWQLKQDREAAEAERKTAEVRERIQSQMKKAQSKGYDLSVLSAVPTTQAMSEFLRESDMAIEVAYHLATHLEELDAVLAEKSSIRQTARLARLEAKLESQETAEPEGKKPFPVVARVAPPPPPLGGRAKAPVADPADASSYAEYKALRMKQLKG